ncbi:MAG TPA: hypothetical protein VHZ97_03015 [Pseudonocardiaceae bacterium]|nr:hypothetical protein [Pseudonocardiaceae bacterium]
MSSENRWHVIPRTPTQCVVNLVVGLLLAVQAIIVLNTTAVVVPALEVIVAVLGCVLVLCAIVGLAAPALRGR